MDQERTPLVDAIVKFGNGEPAYFRIPAHRFERGMNSRFRDAAGEGVFRCDLSEAEGLDDLHQPTGVIREAQELAADLWGAQESFFLVNGTTCGNEAMVLSVAGPGERVLVPRNAHKSILMGLILSGAEPCYVYPRYEEKWNLWGSVTPEVIEAEFQKRSSGYKAVFLVSPTYYGICSDLRRIGEICRNYGAALCVDEAHGSHLYFSDMLPEGALQQGVDLCAQSIHKTAGSMTQSSLLQIGSGRVDRNRIAANLHLVQSTSPSYVLMASLDAARQELALHGKDMMERAVFLAQMARKGLAAISGIQVLEKGLTDANSIFDLDSTRVVFSARELGISGYRLQELLYEQSGVSTELADEENVVCVVTFANTRQEIERLVGAVQKIAGQREVHGKPLKSAAWTILKTEKVMNPREAYFHRKETIRWEEAAGKIAGEMIVPYPPGIPLVYPGEVISPEIWLQVEEYRRKGLAIHGPSDQRLKTLKIIS